MRESNKAKLMAVFEAAGVEILNGNAPGARLRKERGMMTKQGDLEIRPIARSAYPPDGVFVGILKAGDRWVVQARTEERGLAPPVGIMHLGDVISDADRAQALSAARSRMERSGLAFVYEVED